MEISIEHLNKNYGKQNVLKDISLHIPIGMYGMLGENGAGKTTLMRILATLSEPTTGMVEINGIDIKRKKEIRKIIGYLPQEFSIYPNMTVYSALDYLGILTELPNNIRKRRINELLKQVNLEHEKNKRFKNLSGGMKRRFGIAQALLNDPKILIIDEPTAGLDPSGRDEILDLVAKLHKERNLTVILVSHSMEDVAKYVNRIMVMNDGVLMYDDTPKHIFAGYRELEQIGLAAPQVTYIMNDLKNAGFAVDVNAITVEEARQSILKNLKGIHGKA